MLSQKRGYKVNFISTFLGLVVEAFIIVSFQKKKRTALLDLFLETETTLESSADIWCLVIGF